MKEIEAVFEKWKSEGRTEEQIYGVRNFLTGEFSSFLEKEIQSAKQEALEVIEKTPTQYMANITMTEGTGADSYKEESRFFPITAEEFKQKVLQDLKEER